MNNRAFLIAATLLFTLISGLADAIGFIHAADVWRNERLVWTSVGKSALGYGSGIIAYWVSVRFLRQLGITAAETTTLFWFGTTIISVALFSGKFARWNLSDKLVAIAVLAGIAWIMMRTAERV